MQALLSVLGVALGIAVVLSIDLVTASSRTAFRLATDAVAGRATHAVTGGATGIPDSVYTAVRVGAGYRMSAPVVDGYIAVPAIPGRVLHLIGIDPFAEAPFRAYLSGKPLFEILDGLILHRAVYAPDVIAADLGIAPGDSFEVTSGGRVTGVTLLGQIDTHRYRGSDNLVVADIATAQEILGLTGRLSRIDLIASNNAQLDAVRAVLPPGCDIASSESRSAEVEKMTVAFSRNLFALSLLALVVGMFLIYNTMTFSVVQRRTLIGDLRTLGVSRREIFALVLCEAGVIGAVGTGLGIILGFLLASGLLGMVTRTINDLYFVVNVRHIDLSLPVVAKAVVLGMGATLLSATLPAREATKTAPRFVQYRSTQESDARQTTARLTAGGLALLLAGAIMVWAPFRNSLISYFGIPPLVTGFALLTPGALVVMVRRLPAGRALGLLGRMASRSIVTQLSRSSVAIAALAIAVGTTVGVTTMVTSFRQSVVDWLEVTLDADLYVSPVTLVSGSGTATLDREVVALIARLEGVAGVNTIRSMKLQTGHGMANLAALDQTAKSRARFEFLEGNREEAWRAVNAGTAALVSEPYAYRYHVEVGDSVTFPTASGRRAFVVSGVYRDYASDIGTVLIDLDAYRRYWRDDSVSGVGLFLAEGTSAAGVKRRIDAIAGAANTVLVRSNRDLRETSMDVFDRTFAITNVLRMLTIVVAFIGVLSALMALQLERERELGVLRALGLTPGQLWRLVTLQTGMMGLLAGVIALPFGTTLAAVLTLVINKRSFGWSVDLDLSAGVMMQAVALAVGAALLAGLYPGFRMSRTPPARALREE